MPSFSVYLSIDNVSFTKPKLKGRAQRLFRPGSGALDHPLHAEVVIGDYSFLTLKHSAFGIDLPDAYLGETVILMKDMENVSVKSLATEAEVMPLTTKHNSSATDYLVKGAVVITFDATKVDHNINSMGKASIFNEDAQRVKKDMEALSGALIDNKKPKHFEMILVQANNTEFGEQAKTATAWERAIRHVKSMSAKIDPLDFWLQHHPEVKTTGNLKSSLIPFIPDLSSGWPDFEPFPRHTRYASKHQLALLHLMGNKLEYSMQTTRIKELRAQSFDAVFLPFTGDHTQALMIVKPEGRGHLLPIDGEACLVKAAYAKKKFQPDTQFNRQVARQIDNMIYAAYAQRAKTATEYLTEQSASLFRGGLSAEKAATLFSSEAERGSEHSARLQSFVRSKADFLVPPIEFAHKSEEEATEEEATEEEASDVEDRGCPAVRLEISALQKSQDWQVYIVKESSYMRKNPQLRLETSPQGRDVRRLHWADDDR